MVPDALRLPEHIHVRGGDRGIRLDVVPHMAEIGGGIIGILFAKLFGVKQAEKLAAQDEAQKAAASE